MVGVCRDTSAASLDEFAGDDRFTLATAPVISDEAALTRALEGCQAVIAVPIAVRKLKASEMVASLVKATAVHGITRVVFTAGEITVRPAAGETFTFRQKMMNALLPPLLALTPYSLYDMVKGSDRARRQANWDWTFVRAPTLHEAPAAGYRFCELSDITSKDGLSREDFAAALLDSVGNAEHHRRLVTVTAGEDPPN